MQSDKKAAVIILIKDDSTLLQLRDDKPGISHPGHWAVIGGMANEGEDAEAAAIRELKEETGYVSKSPVKFMIEIYKSPSGGLVEAHRFYDYYDGKQEIHCFEGKNVEWKTLQEIDDLKMIETQRYAAKAAIELANKPSQNF